MAITQPRSPPQRISLQPSRLHWWRNRRLRTKNRSSMRSLPKRKRVKARISWTHAFSKARCRPSKSKFSCNSRQCSSYKLWRAWSPSSNKNSLSSWLLNSKSNYYSTSSKCSSSSSNKKWVPISSFLQWMKTVNRSYNKQKLWLTSLANNSIKILQVALTLSWARGNLLSFLRTLISWALNNKHSYSRSWRTDGRKR